MKNVNLPVVNMFGVVSLVGFEVTASVRTKVKDQFFAREGENITYTPIFMQSVAKAIRQYPMINISVALS